MSVTPDAAGAARASALPDVALKLVVGKSVVVEAASGARLAGRLLGFDAATLTLSLSDGGDVVAVQRDTITSLRLLDQATPAAVEASTRATTVHPSERATDPREGQPATKGETRHVGLHFAAAPSLMLDVDYGRFYGFGNFNLVFPLATAGSRLWLAGSVGGGASFRISPSSGWTFDVFAHVAPASLGPNDHYVGLGLGIGMHCTFASGFSFAFKIPAIGYSFDPGSGGLDSREAVAFFYLSSAMGLPLVSVGYRF